jgi:hypothetical protein
VIDRGVLVSAVWLSRPSLESHSVVVFSVHLWQDLALAARRRTLAAEMFQDLVYPPQR